MFSIIIINEKQKQIPVTTASSIAAETKGKDIIFSKLWAVGFSFSYYFQAYETLYTYLPGTIISSFR